MSPNRPCTRTLLRMFACGAVISSAALAADPPAATTGPSTAPTTAPSTARSTPPVVVPSTAPAPATAPAAHAQVIRDDAHFFDADTIARASEKIDAIHHRFGKQVVVETYDTIPEDHRRRFDDIGKEQFFKEWLLERARARSTDGVFILICRRPGRLQMAAGVKTREKAFLAADVEELDTIMNGPFRDHDYGTGLMRGVNFIDKRMEKNGAAIPKR